MKLIFNKQQFNFEHFTDNYNKICNKYNIFPPFSKFENDNDITIYIKLNKKIKLNGNCDISDFFNEIIYY